MLAIVMTTRRLVNTIMKNSRKFAGIVTVAVLAALSIYVGLKQSPREKRSIWIDAARPISIEPPMGIVEIGANGELGLHLPTDAGRGWKGEGGGEATYQFFAPQDGSYTIWAWCLWHDACTNAVYAQFDDSAKAILGNDPVFGKWHWVKGFDVPLKAGFHRLRLSNHSANIAIQKVFLTNDPLQAPPDADPAPASSLFSDDFNGCDKGNLPMWRKVSGKWDTSHPADRKNAADNILTGISNDEALIIFDNDNWRDIHLTVSVFCDLQGDGEAYMAVRFAVASDNDYQEFRLLPMPGGQEAIVRHVQCKSGAISTLAEGRIPWRQASWHELMLDACGERPSLLLDGGASFRGGKGGEVAGGVGLSLHSRMTASFDNVLVQSASGGNE